MNKTKLMRLWKNIYFKSLISLIVLLAIFGLGVLVGQDKISFANNNLNSNLPNSLNYSSVNQEYSILKNNFDGQLTQTQLLNGIKRGMARATGDPYTEYLTANEVKAFNSELNTNFSGVGVELMEDANNQFSVISVVANSPASKAGIAVGNIITAVNNHSTNGQTLDQVVSNIRGKTGSTVNLTLINNNKSMSITLIRQNIAVPSVTYKIIDGDIGYIDIYTFSKGTINLIQKASYYMVDHHVKGVILDLRGNPGGLVSAAVATCSEWLNPGQVIMQEYSGDNLIQTYRANGGDILHGLPTVVLVDGYTASAAEITAGALKDWHYAYLIGEKTFGKGVVEDLFQLDGGAELKVTVASWQLPDGQDIEKKGIQPNEVVKPASDGIDNQLSVAVSYLSKH